MEFDYSRSIVGSKSDFANIVANAAISPNFSPHSTEQPGSPIPNDLLGAKIVKFGTINRDVFPSWNSSVGAAGMAIEYVPEGENEVRRLVLGVSDLGVWIEWHGVSVADQKPGQNWD